MLVEQCKTSSKSPIMLRRSRSGVRIADFVRVSFCHDNPGSALPGQLVCQIPEARNRKGEGSSSAATFPTKKTLPASKKKLSQPDANQGNFPQSRQWYGVKCLADFLNDMHTHTCDDDFGLSAWVIQL